MCCPPSPFFRRDPIDTIPPLSRYWSFLPNPLFLSQPHPPPLNLPSSPPMSCLHFCWFILQHCAASSYHPFACSNYYPPPLLAHDHGASRSGWCFHFAFSLIASTHCLLLSVLLPIYILFIYLFYILFLYCAYIVYIFLKYCLSISYILCIYCLNISKTLFIYFLYIVYILLPSLNSLPCMLLCLPFSSSGGKSPRLTPGENFY